MVATLSAFEGLRHGDERFFVGVIGGGKGVEMADRALGYHGFGSAAEGAFEGFMGDHGAAGDFEDHTGIDYGGRVREIGDIELGEKEGTEDLVGLAESEDVMVLRHQLFVSFCAVTSHFGGLWWRAFEEEGGASKVVFGVLEKESAVVMEEWL